MSVIVFDFASIKICLSYKSEQYPVSAVIASSHTIT